MDVAPLQSPPAPPLPMVLHTPPARRRPAWTDGAGWDRVASQGCPGAQASGRATWEGWEERFQNTQGTLNHANTPLRSYTWIPRQHERRPIIGMWILGACLCLCGLQRSRFTLPLLEVRV